jgi:type VI secretion system secreted protein Hcp
MKTEAKKARVALAVLVHLGAIGTLFLAFADNPGDYTGAFGTAASAQSLDPGTPVNVPVGTAIYVNFGDIGGESEDIDHEGWINLLSFKQGQYIPASSIGAAAGRATSVFEEIALKKELDKSSPKLAEAVSLGRVFPKVQIHVTRALSDGTRVTYYVYELANAVLTSYRIRGSTRDDVPLDDISLNFERIKVTYTKFDGSGRYESIVEYGWDVARNLPR